MQVEGGGFVEKKYHFGKYLRWVDQIPKFFYQSFLGCMAKDDKKKFGPEPGQACWAWVQSSQGRAQFGWKFENDHFYVCYVKKS